MNKTTQNLFEAFNLIEPPVLLEIEYRVYYDQEGHIVKGTSTKKDYDLSIPSIVVTKEQYESTSNYEVRKGRLERIQRKYCLQPSTTGQKVVKYHSALPLESNENYKEIQYYE